MQANVYNLKNEVVGTASLPERIFGAKWNSELVRQVLFVQLANRKGPYAHAKGRGEIRGGGRKPWKQKGTGRSRQGSIRSPLWKGGGVSHGPVNLKNYEKKINQKMRQGAVFSALSRKLKDGELKIVDALRAENLKTKELAKNLQVIVGFRSNALLVGGDESRAVNRIAKNIPHVSSIGARSLNIRDILNHKNVLLEKSAIEILEKQYIKSNR